MRILKFISLALPIMALMSFAETPVSIASSNDDSHLGANDGVYMAPGSMNRDIQQARTTADKYLANKDRQDHKTEATQGEVSQKVQAQAQEKPKPELKKKQSSKGGVKKLTAQGVEARTITSSHNYNVVMGSGTPILINADGKVYAEKINNVLHVYAGFGNTLQDTIQHAIDYASGEGGGIVLVKSNYYSEGLNLKSGVKLYGGYNEYGERDVLNRETIIGGAQANGAGIAIWGSDIEVNGFTVTGQSAGIISEEGSSNVKILNNKVIGGYLGIQTNPGTKNIVIANNDISEAGFAICTYSNATVSNNRVHDNGRAFYVSCGDTSVFKNNVLWNNSSNFALYNEPGNGFNVFENNTVCGGSNEYYGGDGRLTNNLFINFNDSDTSSVTKAGNDYYNDLSQVGIDPMNGIFTSTVSNKGYSINNTENDYNQIAPFILTLKSSSAYNAAKTIQELQNYMSDSTSYNQFSPALISSLREDSTSQFLGGMLKNALSDKRYGFGDSGKGTEPTLAVKITIDAALMSALALPQGRITQDHINAASALQSILLNPTESQKVTIDSIKALVTDINKIEDPSGMSSPELKKASDDLLQMVANILLAQAVPDLLKQGDVSNIKAIFSELDTQRNKIMLQYSESAKPYYENMIKDMAKNMAMLQSKNLLNPNITKEELSKLPPSELDKILEKIRSMKNRTFEEEYILQQEAKYRKDYLDPNRQKLEEHMKLLLKDFTGRLNDVLKSTDKK